MKRRDSFSRELTAILVKNNLIEEKEALDLQKAFKGSSKESFDEFVLEEGIVDHENLLKALGRYYKVPPVDVVGYFFQPFLLHKFPKDVLHRHAFIPMDVADDIMTVVASEPDDPQLLAIIGRYVSYDVVFRIGLRNDITDAITEFYDRAVTEVPQDLDLRAERAEDRDFRHESLLDGDNEELPFSSEDIID